MFAKRKLVNVKKRGQPKMADDASFDHLLAYLMSNENFKKEIYEKSLDVSLNRIESQTKDISERDLLQFVRELFSVSKNQHEEIVNRVSSQDVSDDCILKITVERAENLAGKDVDGSSDPYCLMSVAGASQYTSFKPTKVNVIKQTRVKDSNLNPEWNETFEITIPRRKVNDSYFQIQVWDDDGKKSSKKVKGVMGMGRYVREVAQSVTAKNDKDDFMGFNSVPLVNIPADGLQTWFKLRTAHSLQTVSGRIKISLSLTSVRKPTSQEDSEYTDDIIYAGILNTCVKKAYDHFEAKGSTKNTDHWNGALPLPSQILIREYQEQHQIQPLTSAIVRWEIYAYYHMLREPGLDMIFMDGLLTELEHSHHGNTFVKSTKFTVETLISSVTSFIQHECRKIAEHREVFSSKKSNDYVIHLGSLLLIFKKISGMGIYHVLRTLDPSVSSDVRLDVITALERGTDDYYITVYESLLDESVDEDNKNINNNQELDKPFGGPEVQILIKLTDRLHKELMFGKAVYHGVFAKVLDIDYVYHVNDVISKNLARDSSTTMMEVNKSMSVVEDPNEVDSETKSTSLFQLYLSMRDLTEVTRSKGGKAHESPGRSVDNFTEEDSSSQTTLQSYHDWFRPTVLRWLQMSKGRTRARLRRAVELDKVQKVDDIVKHSSSAVDTIACLTGVVTFWGNLQWPDPVDAFTIALRLTDDMASAIESYADLVHEKLRKVGFFDDEGQFDVTEELCIALNNLQYVKLFLEGLPEKINFAAMAQRVERHPEGPSGERVLSTFSSLVNSAEIGMKKKIQAITAVVGNKMKPDIRRYLRLFAKEVTKSGNDVNYHRNHDSSIRKDLEHKADAAVKPLMKYLEENVVSLHGWLCEPNFRRILEVLWDVTVASIHKVVLDEFVEQRPYFFYQCRHIFKQHLADFFHADGAGISKHHMRKSNKCKLIDSELKMRCARTQDLMKLFYMQMYEEQQKNASNPVYGYLNVHAWFDQSASEINVDVISADNLIALDINGLSDPFVQLRLAPKMLFRDHRSHQTLVEKKTLDPMWSDESFTFKVDRQLVKQEGTVLIFTVLDHDIISSNDLEGEAVLPLSMLDGVEQNRNLRNGQTKISRNFKLPLTQPQKSEKSPLFKRRQVKDFHNDLQAAKVHKTPVESVFSNITLDETGLDYESSLVISPLYLLQGRTYDKDANEFCRWRLKQEKATESENDGK